MKSTYILGLISTIVLALGTSDAYSQKNKPFSGMFEYKITTVDTSLSSMYPENKMLIYTNDTIVRIENFTKTFGKQVTIRHISKQKSYQLLETDFGKFAIQNSVDSTDTVTKKVRYNYTKKCKKKKILGLKANSYEVGHEAYEAPKQFFYFKKFNNKYITTFPEIPGLLAEYYVTTYDVIYKYELVRINEYNPDRDLFGVPSDYQKISIDDFMDKMMEFKSSTPQ